MPSTYTVNLGLEKVASGEKAGEWGNSLNTSLDSIDTAVNGAIDMNLPGTGAPSTPNTIDVIDGTGAGSLGRNKYINIVDSGDLGGSVYLKLNPADAEKVGWIKNSLSGSRDLILFQGTYNASNDLVIAAGTTVLAKFDGAGAGAVVTNVLDGIAGALTGNVTGDVTGDLTGNADTATSATLATTATTANNVDASSTDEVQLPANTEANRPASPSVGNIRYNTSDQMLEVYKGNIESNIGNQWRPVTGFELIDIGSGNSFGNFADIIHRVDRDSTTNGRTAYSYAQYKLILSYYSTANHDFYLYPIYVISDNSAPSTTTTSYAMNYTARSFSSYYTRTLRNQNYIDVNHYGDSIDAFASVVCQIDWSHTMNSDAAPPIYSGQASYVSYNYTAEEQTSNFQGTMPPFGDQYTFGFRAYVSSGAAVYAWALYGLRQVQE